MRSVRTSNTFDQQLVELLKHASRYDSDELIDAKRAQIFYVIRHFIAWFPALKPPHPKIGPVAYPISKTPFVILYD